MHQRQQTSDAETEEEVHPEEASDHPLGALDDRQQNEGAERHQRHDDKRAAQLHRPVAASEPHRQHAECEEREELRK